MLKLKFLNDGSVMSLACKDNVKEIGFTLISHLQSMV